MPTRLVPLLALLALAPTAAAQMLPSGTWTGTLVGTNGQSHAVEVEMERCATGFTLALSVDGRTAEVPESRPATWERGRLRFTTSRLRLPGALVPRALACDLEADDAGALRGLCTTGRAQVRLRLDPPADGAFGCE